GTAAGSVAADCTVFAAAAVVCWTVPVDGSTAAEVVPATASTTGAAAGPTTGTVRAASVTELPASAMPAGARSPAAGSPPEDPLPPGSEGSCAVTAVATGADTC